MANHTHTYKTARLEIQNAADIADIIDIFVPQEDRRKGYATKALQNILAELAQQGVKTCFLEVRASNVAAIALYEKLGFIRIGERVAYYSNPTEDAWLYKIVITR